MKKAKLLFHTAGITFLSLLIAGGLSGCFKSHHSMLVEQGYRDFGSAAKSVHRIPVIVVPYFARDAACARAQQATTEMLIALQRNSGASADRTVLQRQMVAIQATPEYQRNQNVVADCFAQGVAQDRSGLAAHRARLATITSKFVEQALMHDGGFEVLDEKLGSERARYIINLSITEIVPDIEAKDREGKGVLNNLGFITSMATPYVSVATAGALGPIGSLLQSFDVITGIPISGGSGKKVGEVTADIKLIDRTTGDIKEAFSKNAQYGAEYKTLGDPDYLESAIGSGNASLSLVTLENAAENIAKDVALRVKQSFS